MQYLLFITSLQIEQCMWASQTGGPRDQLTIWQNGLLSHLIFYFQWGRGSYRPVILATSCNSLNWFIDLLISSMSAPHVLRFVCSLLRLAGEKSLLLVNITPHFSRSDSFALLEPPGLPTLLWDHFSCIVPDSKGVLSHLFVALMLPLVTQLVALAALLLLWDATHIFLISLSGNPPIYLYNNLVM